MHLGEEGVVSGSDCLVVVLCLGCNGGWSSLRSCDGLVVAVVWRHVGAGMLATLVLVLIELEEDE